LIKKLTCISCPIGCELSVSLDENGKIVDIEGNRCPRGEEYAISEITDPKRILPISVKVENGEMELVSAKTDKPVPKKRLNEIIDYIKKLKVKAPIKRGDVIVKNILETGANLVATRTVNKKS
jgi:CxxC motif-containing protein